MQPGYKGGRYKPHLESLAAEGAAAAAILMLNFDKRRRRRRGRRRRGRQHARDRRYCLPPRPIRRSSSRGKTLRLPRINSESS